jgi:integrase
MRKANTAISEIKINGVTRYRVTYPTATGRKREHYVDRKKAESRLKEIKTEQKRFGLSVDAMSSTTRAQAVAATEILAGSGITLVEAARFILAEKKREQSGVPIKVAVEAFLRSRDDRSDDYRNTLKPRLEYIEKFFAGRTTASIKANDCQQLLDGLAGTQSPRTVSHYRTHLSVFMKFCESREWITGNPAKRTTQVKVPGQDTAILPPEEAATLLSVCHEDILPGVIIAMFCGLRNAEIERLDWKAVSLAQGIITIGAGVAKTNSRRVCAIPKNAKAWLASYAKKAGKVWPADETRARDLWTLARVQAGYGPFTATSNAVKEAMTDPATGKERKDLKPWPANVLRHSSISYRVALEKNLAKVAYEAGNSPGIIQRHYNGLATPQAAKAFFDIMPDVAENVTHAQFKAA